MKLVLSPLTALVFSVFSFAELQPLEDMDEYVIESTKSQPDHFDQSLPTSEIVSDVRSQTTVPKVPSPSTEYIMKRTITPFDGGISMQLKPTRVVADRF